MSTPYHDVALLVLHGLLFKILSVMHPRDLLALTRVSKSLRLILLKQNTQVWGKARVNRGLPDPMPGLHEIKYSCIFFKNECMVSPFFVTKSISKESQWFFQDVSHKARHFSKHGSSSVVVPLVLRDQVSYLSFLGPRRSNSDPFKSSVHKGIYMIRGAEAHDEQSISVFKMVPRAISGSFPLPRIEPDVAVLTNLQLRIESNTQMVSKWMQTPIRSTIVILSPMSRMRWGY